MYVFWPVAVLLGVPIEDCLSVAKLIGIKTFINEFVAYKELGSSIEFRNSMFAKNLTDSYRNGTITVPANIPMIWNVNSMASLLHYVIFSTNFEYLNKIIASKKDKSIVISTYALCGFSNFGSIGILIGSLSALCPSKSNVFGRLGFRAMIAG
jgi:pyrimidine nucleoside transport protein